MARLTRAGDLPPGGEITADERSPEGHGVAVRCPGPERGRGERGGPAERAHSAKSRADRACSIASASHEQVRSAAKKWKRR